MVKRHLKRFATPITWKIKKKGIKFVTRPNPGTHQLSLCVPISLAMKEMIKCARTTSEVRKLLHANEVLVDGRRVRDHRFPVGLMDVIHIKPTKQFFRVTFDKKGYLNVISIDEKEAKYKICEIISKTAVKGGKMQLNLRDSRNILVDKGEFQIGGSVMIEVPSQKIIEEFKLEKGAAVLLIAGKHISEEGVVENAEGNKIIFKNAKGESITTSVEYAFAVGKGKPAIKVT